MVRWARLGLGRISILRAGSAWELHAEEPFQATLMVMWNTSAIVSVRSKLNYRLWLLLCLS